MATHATVLAVSTPVDPTVTWAAQFTKPMKHERLALSIALISLGVSFVVGMAAYKIVANYRDWRPLVYRVNDHGEAIAERYSVAGEGWNEDDAKFEIETYVRCHYGRDRVLIGTASGFSRSILYLSQKLAAQANLELGQIHLGACSNGIAEECTVATFRNDLMAPEIAIRIADREVIGFVQNSYAPFQASFTFWEDLTWVGGQKRTALCKWNGTAHFMKPPVPEDDLPADRNPRGLVIDSFQPVSCGY